MAQRVKNLTVSLRMWAEDLALLWLWHRLQMRLRSGVAVAVAYVVAPIQTPSPGTSMCPRRFI